MEFNSVEFINIFFPICLLFCSVYPQKGGYVLLLFSSIFYAWNSTVGFFLLVFSVVVVHNFKKQEIKSNLSKILLVIFLVLPFIFFRSSTFLIKLIPILAEINKNYPESLILPAGVSFYTFQLIGYLFDRDPQSNKTTFKESLLFILFFPQLIAGPIERAKDLIPQIRYLFSKGILFNKINIQKGLYLISLGLFLKTFFSDYLGSKFIGDFYKNGTYAAITHILSNGMVIYFDFLGYTFIALGLAKFFNLNLTLNFKRPYASICVAEFWRRWHITLTTWFKDYIYKPISSIYNYSKIIVFFSTFVVFILTAQWHGFGFRFLIWGGSHFVLVILSREISPYCKNIYSKYFLWFISFSCINFLWLFFFYDLEKSMDIFSYVFNYKSFDLNTFPKRIIWLTQIALFASLLIDPEEIVNYPKTIEKKSNNLVIFSGISEKFTRIFLKITHNIFFSMFFIFASIAFFSYSRTFIYFRF